MFKKIVCIFVLSLSLIHPIKAQKDFKDTMTDTANWDNSEICQMAVVRMEEKYKIKNHLLETILSVESGTWNQQKSRFEAWPWSVNVNGKGYRYKTKDEAVAAVKKFQKQGYKSIDVGCMQINLKFHGREFESVEDAFEPQKNVEYSAKFLANLYKKYGNWQKAATTYHSKVPSHASIYRNRLLKRFNKLKIAFLDNNESITLF